jgi:hypothetical protein
VNEPLEEVRHTTIVVPAEAGTHIPEAAVYGTMGPRLRGDDRAE